MKASAPAPRPTVAGAFRGAARLTTVLAGAALAELVVAALAWRTGLWHYGTSLMLMQWCATTALAGVAAGTIAFFGRQRLSAALGSATLLSLLACVLLFYMASHDLVAAQLGLHDISTDTESPPRFVALLPRRAAANSFPPRYPGPRAAELQKAAYPDLAPLHIERPPEQAFALALAAAERMPRWAIAANEPATGRIEATARSRWLGFKSDIVVRVAAEGAGSRVDVRAVSRLRFGDFGINAERIRLYLAAVREAAE